MQRADGGFGGLDQSLGLGRIVKISRADMGVLSEFNRQGTERILSRPRQRDTCALPVQGTSDRRANAA